MSDPLTIALIELKQTLCFSLDRRNAAFVLHRCALLDEARLAAPMSPEVFASATKTMPVAVLDPASYLASGVVDMASPVLAAAPEMEVITRGAAPCLEGTSDECIPQISASCQAQGACQWLIRARLLPCAYA